MGLKKDLFSGVAVTAIAKYSGILIGLVINAMLARLLSPKEYGIVGVVIVFITFFNILSDIGLGSAIVQNQNLSQKDHSDLFKLSAIMSSVLAIAFALFSYAVAFFYKNDVYIPIGQLLAIHVFFSSLSVVPKNLLIKSQLFKKIAIIEVCTALTAGLIAVLLASQHYSYFAIVWRSIFMSSVTFVLYFLMSGVKFQKGLSLAPARRVAKYSSFQFGFNFINYFSRNLDNILIGKFMGNVQLGVYNQAYQLMMYPIANLTFVITPVLHPILAKYQHDKAFIYKEYVNVVNILAVLGIPISVFVFFSSEEIVQVMLGSKWSAVVPVLKVLSLSVWIQMILSSSGSIFQASGRTDLLFLSGALSAVFTIGAILAGIFYYQSMQATAWLLVSAFAFNFFQGFYTLIVHALKESPRIFIKAILSKAPMALAMVVTLLAKNRCVEMMHIDLPLIPSILINIVICLVFFILFQHALVSTLVKKFVPQRAT
ncbi:lipopolysaccharide biosynthesis protein [Dyadobacter fermentans]|uniref:Polysaccharide biosynthesis protein n=1 Tax=Dyadobacter fermentans (strain ATCC 700827 / DSM 18053 / CIP 107007 / KCTC 52180 / NS114) TaxID=471854 RepID=C6VZ17_DYAFD|nr:lipopolysaccharide biosynthesis protein [Dyadobacter fermentans]ACT95223.1 polysaccharide biosynthesis protein [Dyadobacter fermentans DSM 18053]